MADRPFAGDYTFLQMQKEKMEVLSRLRRARKIAVADFVLSVSGSIACLVHLNAPWFVLFEMFKIGWIFKVLFFSAIGSVIWFAYEIYLFSRRIKTYDQSSSTSDDFS